MTWSERYANANRVLSAGPLRRVERGPTSLGFALLAAVDQQVSRALGAEWQQQVLDQRWDEGQ